MKQGLYFGLIVLLVFALISLVRAMVFQRRLFRYLLERHSDKWNYLTTIGNFGPGNVNGLRTIKYLFNKEHDPDAELMWLKISCRNSLLFTVTGFFAVFLWFCIIVGIYPD